MDKLDVLWGWMLEREVARKRKESGLRYVGDPILERYHFCNVHREDDRTTKELRALAQGIEVKDLPAFYTMARMFNYAPTVEVVTRWWGRDWREPLYDMKKRGQKLFHTAYVVSTCGQRIDKIDYVWKVVHNVREIATKIGIIRRVPSLHQAAQYLNRAPGLGKFMTAQVIADLKNDRYLVDAPDWWTWSWMGPGSKKGLDIIFGGGTTNGNYEARMIELAAAMPPEIKMLKLHMQDLQNCLCEFSKYMAYLENRNGRTRHYKRR